MITTPAAAAASSGSDFRTAPSSRISCIEFPDVLGVSDYAGLARGSRYRSWPYCLPLQMTASAPRLRLFEARYPARLCPCLRFRGGFTAPTVKLGAERIATPFS